jgi:hypothetical protein
VSSTKMLTNMKDMLMLIWQCHISYVLNRPFVPYCGFFVPLWDVPKSSPLFSCAIFEFKFRRKVSGFFFFLLHYLISFKKSNFLNKINNMGWKEYMVAHQQLPNVERMGYYTAHGVTTQLPHHLLSMNGISNFLS